MTPLSLKSTVRHANRAQIERSFADLRCRLLAFGTLMSLCQPLQHSFVDVRRNTQRAIPPLVQLLRSIKHNHSGLNFEDPRDGVRDNLVSAAISDTVY